MSELPGILPDETDPTQASAPVNATMAAGGGPGMSAASSIVNALAGAAGYATRDPILEQHAMASEDMNRRMNMYGPVGAALGAANMKLAAGDVPGATQEYSKVAHLGVLVPQVQQFGTKLAEQAYALKTKAELAKVLSQPDRIEGAAPDAGAEGPVGPPTDNRQAKLNQLVTLGMDPEKATKMVYPDLQHVTADDGSIYVINPRTAQFALVRQGMGKAVPAGESLVAQGPNGIAPTYTAPKLLDVPSALEPHMSATDRVIYNQGINARTPEGLAAADEVTARAEKAYAATKSPSDVKGAAQRLGYGQADIAAFENGTLEQGKAQRITAKLLQDDMVKKANEMSQAKRISLEMDPASKSFSKYAAYADRNGNLVDAGSLSGADAIKGMKSGDLAPMDAEAQRRYQMANNLTPQFQMAKDQIPRLFAGATPGTNLGNALKIYTQRVGGAGAARVQESLAIDMAGEQGKLLTGSSRVPVTMFNQYLGHGAVGQATDTVESALAKAEFGENVTNSAKINLTNREGMKTVDPYKTNPVLRQLDTLRQAGKHPVLSVDRQGNYTIVSQ